MWLITTCVDVLPSPFDPSPDESRQLPQSAAKARDIKAFLHWAITNGNALRYLGQVRF